MKKLTKAIILSTVIAIPIKVAIASTEVGLNGDPVSKRRLEMLRAKNDDSAAHWTDLMLPPVDVVLSATGMQMRSSDTPEVRALGDSIIALARSEEKEPTNALTSDLSLQAAQAEQLPKVETAPSEEVMVFASIVQLAKSETPAPSAFDQPLAVVISATPLTAANIVAPTEATQTELLPPAATAQQALVVFPGANPLVLPGAIVKESAGAPAGTSTLTPTTALQAQPKKVRVRITFYSGQDDKWGSKVAWNKVEQAKRGRTVAADPTVFPYGTWIDIPGFGKHRVEDTGSAVKTRKASGGTDPIIDIYVAHESEVARLAKLTPAYVEITLL